MSKSAIRKLLIGLLILVGISGFVAWWASGRADQSVGHWYSIVPPLLAITAAFVARRVAVSLGLAIVVGGILTQWPYLTQGLSPWLAACKASLGFVTEEFTPFNESGQLHVPESIFILGFVVVIFAMIEILVQAGGFNGVVRILLRFVKTRRSAEFVTSLLGISCFIDDYTNAIVVGSAMRPITDRYGVSREKLAFLVDATSAPIAGLAVISTWIAYEVGLFTDVAAHLEIDQNGYGMFFDALGYRFYCVFMILFVFMHVLFGQDFGPMKAAQKAIAPDRVLHLDQEARELSLRQGKARSALVPLLGLIVFHVCALWVAGDGLEKLHAGMRAGNWSYWRDTISDVPSSSRILFYSSCMGVGLAALSVRIWERQGARDIMHSLLSGARKGLLPVKILILAWSLKNCCNALHTGEFLASVLVGTLSAAWFAPLVFVVASLTSFATGTSYGTMAILIPTAIPVAFALDGHSYGVTTMIALGAVLDGAIFGDHCSPISDTTILSSISSQCDLLQHVRTQMPYSLLVACLALTCGYFPSAQGLGWAWCTGLAGAMMVGLFLVIRLSNSARA